MRPSTTGFILLPVGWLFPFLMGAVKDEGTFSSRVVSRFAITALVTAALLLGTGLWRSTFDEEYPAPESIRYELQAQRQEAHWVSGDPQLGEWTRNFLSPEQRTDTGSLLADWHTTFVATAPLAGLLPPTITLLEEEEKAEERCLTIRLATPRDAYLLSLDIQAGHPIRYADIEGHPLELTDYQPALEGRLRVNYVACPPEGINLRLKIAGTGPVSVSLVDMKTGLEELPQEWIPRRPATTMPSPLGADGTVVGYRESI